MDLTITQLRKINNLTQAEFASYFGIPIGTLRNWEQGIAKPPAYVFSMIFTMMRRDKMINIETIELMGIINELSSKAQKGHIKDFKEATQKNQHQNIFYDSTNPFEERYPDEDPHYPIILDMMVDEIHHDAVSYYENTGEYDIGVAVDDVNVPYIEIRLFMSKKSILIENGKWYIVNN